LRALDNSRGSAAAFILSLGRICDMAGMMNLTTVARSSNLSTL